MEGIAFMFKGSNQSGGLESSHGSRREEPPLGGGSTFLAKREC
jgi:hypothetical protein